MCSSTQLLLLPVAMALLHVAASSQVVQVMVLSRHGLGAAFPPDANQIWDDAGDLSGHGYRQMQNMGVALNQRYCNASNRATKVPTGWDWSTLAAQVNSASTDMRPTMMSAQSFMLGFFPLGTGPIDELTGKPALRGGLAPIATHAMPMEDDILLRAHDKCPTFDHEVETVMATQEMGDYEIEHRDVFNKISELGGVESVTPSNFLQVFDIVAAKQVFNSTIADGNQWRSSLMMMCLSSVTSCAGSMQKVADYLAKVSFTSPATTTMIAGNYLNHMLETMNAAADGDNVLIPFCFVSGHYPTLMAVNEALGTYGEGGIPYELPSPGAMLIIELHEQRAHVFAVRLVLHDPDRGHDFVEVAQSRCGSATLCPLEQFVTIANKSAVTTPGEWCTLCNNTITPVCLSAHDCPTPSKAMNGAARGAKSGRSRSEPSRTDFMIGISAGIFFSSIIFATMQILHNKKYHARLLSPERRTRTSRTRTSRGSAMPDHIELPAHVEMSSAA